MAGELTFGQRLRAFRERAGLSQTELAKRSGLPQTSIAAWELDKADPGWQKVQALCRALNVNCDAFTTIGAPAPEPTAPVPPKPKSKRRKE